MTTKDSLIRVQRCMDENEQDINEVVAKRSRQEEEGEGVDVPIRKNNIELGAHDLVDAINPMLQANEAHSKRRNSNMKYFVSSIEDDNQNTIGEEDSGTDKLDGAKLRGSLVERQRKSWARTTEIMDGAAVGGQSYRNDGDTSAKSAFQQNESFSPLSFPTVFAALLPASVNSTPSFEPVNPSLSAQNIMRYQSFFKNLLFIVEP